MPPDVGHNRRDIVRGAVRGLLQKNPGYASLAPDRRKQLAHDLVALTETSLALMTEEAEADPHAAQALARTLAPQDQVLSRAQEAPSDFNPAANRQLAQTARDTLDGIAFPRFVTELVNGVFKGLIDANAQQIGAYVDMISGVTAASADSSGATGPDQARTWLVQQFPGSYELGASVDDWGEEQQGGSAVVRLREGADPPTREDVAQMLELEGEDAEGFDPEEPEEGLLGKVRAYLARKRQKVIASLLTLGLTRLVIDHGKINAGMNFSIDAHSAAEENRARRFEFRHSSTAGGSAGIGPWSVNASMTNSIGIVNTTQSHRREEMNQQVSMNADVELHFHTDYIPLNQFAARNSVARIRAVSANPSAPAPPPPTRQRNAADRDAARRVVSTPINIPGPGTPPPIHRADTGEDTATSRRRQAQDARQDADAQARAGAGRPSGAAGGRPTSPAPSGSAPPPGRSTPAAGRPPAASQTPPQGTPSASPAPASSPATPARSPPSS